MTRVIHLPEELVELIYERITDDEPWRKPLEMLRTMLDASNLMICLAGKGARTRDALFAYGPKVDQAEVPGWEERIYRDIFPVNPPEGETVFFQWEKVLKKKEQIRYMQRYDSSWTITHCFESNAHGDGLLIGSRELEASTFNGDDAAILIAAGRHFKRALRLRREYLRLRIASDFQGEGLARMGIGAILVENSGKAVALNHTEEMLSRPDAGLAIRNERLLAKTESDDKRLQAAIRQVLSGKGDRMKARALTLSAPGTGRGMGLLIQGRPSVSLASGKPDTNVMVFVRDIQSAADVDLDLTRDLFGFTAAEARLAAGLARGHLLNELEAELGISHNTARAHLRSIFAKTDVSRQSQLVYLLANCVAPLGPG